VPPVVGRQRLEQAPLALLDHEHVEGTRFEARTDHGISDDLVERVVNGLSEGLEVEQLTHTEGE
jgi:hypothetical protein